MPRYRKLYAEHLKYAKSNKLFSAVLLLFTMIWTMMKVPETWLSSVITCLHKRFEEYFQKLPFDIHYEHDI